MSIKLDEGCLILRVGALRDAAGVDARPGVVVVQDGTVIFAGAAERLDLLLPAGDATSYDFSNMLIMPGMVNAHAHLSMSALGPQPYTGQFTDWIVSNAERLKRYFEQGGTVRQAVEQGVQMLWESGVTAVGDVTLRVEPFEAYRALGESGLAGVSHVEILSAGGPSLAGEQARLAEFQTQPASRDSVRLGLQPHAPYSTVPPLYQACVDAAVERDLPIMTHLAELPEEAQYVRTAGGPFRELIEKLGQWRDETATFYNADISAVAWAKPYLEQTRFVAAHCNHVSDADLAILASTNTSVAYCPVASDYFGHRNHRYRDMLEAGINVCLGSDSIVCFDPRQPQPLAPLTAMRHLHHRDHTNPELLLAMATIYGVRALRLDPLRYGTLAPGSVARFAAVRFDPENPADALEQVLRNESCVETITQVSSRPSP